MPEEPFIDPSQRPDLTIDLESRVGDITVRQLSEILGRAAPSEKVRDVKQIVKENIQDKPPKEAKDSKDHKDPKEHKDQKDTKDHKEPKDSKDQKDTKEVKDQKDQKDTKDQKDPKDSKDQKDSKDHKDPKDPKEHKDAKDHKDEKDIVDRKAGLHDKVALTPIESKATAASEGLEAGPVATSGLEDLIQRISHLEQEIADQKREDSQG
jgi:hypothetical protein